MPINTKEMIAKTVQEMVVKENCKKLTVKDIVERCEITRQTFYYHFCDVPDLINWIYQQVITETVEKSLNTDDMELAIQYFFEFALEGRTAVRRALNTNYSQEIKQLLVEGIKEYLETLIEKKRFFLDDSRADLKMAINYHAYAIAGILYEWDNMQDRPMDQLVHKVCLLMSGNLLHHN